MKSINNVKRFVFQQLEFIQLQRIPKVKKMGKKNAILLSNHLHEFDFKSFIWTVVALHWCNPLGVHTEHLDKWQQSGLSW